MAKSRILCSPWRNNKLWLACMIVSFDRCLSYALVDLCELDDILFSTSPLLKSVAKRAEVDYVMIEEDILKSVGISLIHLNLGFCS
ncbi:hypothetical protein LINPERPRIM_LOCUS25431 [Linum perenne]